MCMMIVGDCPSIGGSSQACAERDCGQGGEGEGGADYEDSLEEEGEGDG